MPTLHWPDVHARGAADLTAAIGRTPLVRLRHLAPPGAEIYAKLESRNPGGSVKDRAALAMILDGERTGRLRPGITLLDATSGNTGVAYAMIGAARGHAVELCVPANASIERRRLLAAYGATVIFTDPMAGTDGAILEARRRYAASPGRYFYPDQYSNPANWRAHYDTTAVEIFEQSGGRLTHFVAGLGTSGTFVGAGRRLRELRPGIRLVSVQPASPLHGLEGLKHMASAIVPPIYDPSLADLNLEIDTETAHDLMLRLAREEGLLAGPSGAAAVAACLEVARAAPHAVLVTVLPDSGERYLADPLWNQSGVRPDPDQGRAIAVRLTPEAAAAIRAAGAAAYPHEGCGAMFSSRPGEVDDVLPLDNTTGEERRRRFLIGPREYRLAEAHATRTGRHLAGFYHSHPDHPAQPSSTDLEQAWPNLSYVIVSVHDGRPQDLRSWRLRDDRSDFDEEFIR